jgi:hypothetical protein
VLLGVGGGGVLWWYSCDFVVAWLLCGWHWVVCLCGAAAHSLQLYSFFNGCAVGIRFRICTSLFGMLGLQCVCHVYTLAADLGIIEQRCSNHSDASNMFDCLGC